MADIKSTLVNLTSNLAKTSGELVKNTKLNLDIVNKEEQLKAIYVDVGKKVHEIYSFGGTLGQPFDDMYKEIVICETSLNDLKSRLDTAKGVRSCPKCGKSVEKRNEFCPHCGNPMLSTYLTSSAEVAPQVNQKLSSEKCIACDYNNPKGSKFCLSCGRVL